MSSASPTACPIGLLRRDTSTHAHAPLLLALHTHPSLPHDTRFSRTSLACSSHTHASRLLALRTRSCVSLACTRHARWSRSASFACLVFTHQIVTNLSCMLSPTL